MEKSKSKVSGFKIFGSKKRKHPEGGIRTGNGLYTKSTKKFYYLNNGD